MQILFFKTQKGTDLGMLVVTNENCLNARIPHTFFVYTSIPSNWLIPTEDLPFPCSTLILFHSSQPLPCLSPLCSCRHTPPNLPFTAPKHAPPLLLSGTTATLKTLYYWKKFIQLHIHLFITSHRPHQDKFMSGLQNNHKYFMLSSYG